MCIGKGDVMELFDAMGFHWDRAVLPGDVPVHSIERACFRFQRMLPEFVWDASMLEGNPFTYPEVQTLLDGITVGGRAISDQEQVLNLAASAKKLLALVRAGDFAVTKQVFCDLHALVARQEAMEWGHFRGEGAEHNYSPHVALGSAGHYTPLPTVAGAPALNAVFVEGVEALHQAACEPLEKAVALFLFGALQQFFFDGNKRTSRLLMNGVLLTNGIDSISVPAMRQTEFNEKMVLFYVTKNATEMMRFMVSCHPDVKHVPAHHHTSPSP